MQASRSTLASPSQRCRSGLTSPAHLHGKPGIFPINPPYFLWMILGNVGIAKRLSREYEAVDEVLCVIIVFRESMKSDNGF